MSARGFGAYRTERLSDARDLLAAFRLDVALATESLIDGSGYALSDAMRRQAGTLIVGVPLSESCLWLPVVERGVAVLGKRAFSPATLELELGRFLGIRALEERKPRRETARLSDGRFDSNRTVRLTMRYHHDHTLD
ncbi:MAG TPA: hypothetical protein VMD78_10490 [Candidatus Baltobacteraceae bacterium]|nr:hypothetical protein [Candidatus Baltobacteraceae bacterium]